MPDEYYEAGDPRIKTWTRMDEADLRAKQKEYDELVGQIEGTRRIKKSKKTSKRITWWSTRTPKKKRNIKW